MKKNFILTTISLVLSVFFALPGFAYSDVPADVENYEAIMALSAKGLVKGYPDNTFRPRRPITRAELAKLLLAVKSLQKPDQSVQLAAQDLNCFQDVRSTHWFAEPVCRLKAEKVLSGDGNGYFHPAKAVNLVEASKFMVLGLLREAQLPDGPYWYSPFLALLTDQKIIPPTVRYLNQELTRAEVAEMLWRQLENIDSKPATALASLENAFCQKTAENLPDGIDIQKIRQTWLTWNNQVRAELKQPAYTHNMQLARTAIEWSEYSENRGYMDHKRPGQTAYYDYYKILTWFKNLGLEFKNVSGTTFTENIGWNYYQCHSGDCTAGLIAGVRKTFDFFLSEKGRAYRPHYESLVNKGFQEIGIGLSVDPTRQKYYLTVHYGTEISSKPLPVCGG